MQRLSLKRISIYAFLFVIIFIGCVFINLEQKNTMEFTLDKSDVSSVQIFYLSKNQDEYSEAQSETFDTTENKDIIFNMASNYKSVRIDFGNTVGTTSYISKMELNLGNQEGVLLPMDIIEGISTSNILCEQIEVQEEADKLKIVSTGEDPYIIIPLDFVTLSTRGFDVLNLGLSSVIALLATIVIFKHVSLKDPVRLVKNIWRSRRTLLKLSLNDFKSRYIGSSFGWIWAFVQPISTILIFWFVFQVGLRSGGVEGVPFILWLMSGLIPWFFFSEAWNGVTSVYSEYNYLVKKVVFNIDVLPIVKITSAIMVHLFFMFFMLSVYAVYGFYPNIDMLLVIYYMFCMTFLIVGLGFATASIVPFFKDVTPIMAIILQMGVWVTPIMWQLSILDESIIWIFKLNPMYYIVTGYRNCMLGDVMPAPTIQETVYFWFISIAIFLAGMTLFRKLKPHFADVL